MHAWLLCEGSSTRATCNHLKLALTLKLKCIRAFPSSVSNVKYLTFDTPNSKKPLSSSILNAIIFYNDEQCNLKFETALFTNCKTHIIFLLRWGPLFFFLVFLPCLSFLLWASNHFSDVSLSLSLSDETQAGASSQANLYRNGFFFFFFSLMVDSVVVVWVMDLAFWGISCLGFLFGHILVG